MKSQHRTILIIVALLLLIGASTAAWRSRMPEKANAKSPSKAFTDYRGEKPGVVHRITVADLPQPYATRSVDNGPRLIARPSSAWPQAPSGFKVELYAAQLSNPRLIRTAPNGDLFLAESAPGRILVFRGVNSDGRAQTISVFATGLELPFGIAFYPPGPNPQYVYVGNTGSVVRFPYQNGDLKARGPMQTVISDIPSGGHLRGGGHWTRDLAFSLDGRHLFISVGSHSNDDDADDNPREFHRADILEANPDGTGLHVYAWGIRNAVGIAVNPRTGELWGSVNERDGLGDFVPPDYITHIQEGGFYGWPWFYIGGHQDPRHKGKHPELKDKVIVPDILVEPHNASLEMTFYEVPVIKDHVHHGRETGSSNPPAAVSLFPQKYRGNIFAAEHGSWNKAVRTGYEVIDAPLQNGHATGEYEDFLTGFVRPDGHVWGRPVGVAVGADGSLYVSDDGSNSIWRVTYR